ncbi:group 1 glycosyl transferase [[Phormidium ambiguum] IAM M-71]|uniref:Group 1 glycosyl transferase n=1 Tax=[Phormidium ambiguum] IAM M-71 TaxID=454136 RepID=A0A1U7I8N6_9CYAN|nr:glycosyltransferase family 4 protein [Phormidium ambiguum]OKH32828.1 group 1 glycosyl transferase [Phormidium ambiguum IAM M-71]
MRLGYVTSYEVFDSSDWQKDLFGIRGAGSFLAKSLENQSVPIDYISPLKQNHRLVNRAKRKLYKKVFNKFYHCWAVPSISKDYALQVSQKLSNSQAEIIICPENAQPVAYLECQQPIVIWTDAPQTALIDWYPAFSNLCGETKRHIYEMEKAAFDRSKLVIFITDWAAESAIKIYGIDRAKVKVIPWGANIECDRNTETINTIIESKDRSPCKLLFIGVDWIRKGGDVALEVAKQLNQSGLKTELFVLGCQPITNEPLPSFVKVLGFIDKSTDEGKAEMKKLFSESHFLIMPSKADCSPMVLSEANSFGLPCLSTKVGGIPNIIIDNLNGKTFALTASISEYCDCITNLMNNYKDYQNLVRSSFNEYQNRFNWSVIGKQAKELISNLL